MAVVSITIPAGVAVDFTTAVQDAYPGEWATAQATGKTAAQFVQSIFVRFGEDIYRAWKVKQSQPAQPAPAGIA